MTYHKLRICCVGAMLVGAPLACMDLDGYRLKTEVAARGGSPPTGSGGTAGAPRGGSAGTCANEVFTLYNDAADREDYSSCGTITLFSWAYVAGPQTETWLFAGDSTTVTVPFGTQVVVQSQCCWFDHVSCFGFTTTCNFYGTDVECACNAVVTHTLTADTCPGEDVVVCA